MTTEQRADLKRLDDAVKQAEAARPKPLPAALGIVDRSSQPAKNFLMVRGEPTHPGEEVSLGFVQVLSHDRSPSDYLRSATVNASSRQSSTMQRSMLAEWLVDVEHGAGALTAG